MKDGQGRQNRLDGIATELVVCGDLLRKGWVAFRSFDHFGPYDIIADDGTRLLKVEAKSGGASGQGHFGSGLHKAHTNADGQRLAGFVGGPQASWPADPKFDVCAIVQRDGSIEYYNRERVRIWTHDFPVTDGAVEVG